MTSLSDVPGIVSARELDATITAIAAHQLADGNLPWIPEATPTRGTWSRR